MTEETIDDYSMFADEYFTQMDVGSVETVEDDIATGYNIWKAADLIDDDAVTDTGTGYGYINDLVFDDGGKLQAVVVNGDNRYIGAGHTGYSIYPWYGYGYDGYAWEPGLDRYLLPFDEEEISDLAVAFEYDELDNDLS